MTNKVTMPDPQLIVDFCENADLHVWEAGNERSAGVVRNASRGEYITTTQAESYANARVREALEQAAVVAERSFCDCCCSDDQKFTAEDAAQSIRALIPKEPPCGT